MSHCKFRGSKRTEGQRTLPLLRISFSANEHALQDPDSKSKASLLRVLTKVSSRASRGTISSASGKPRPPNRDDSAMANKRTSFTDMASMPSMQSMPSVEQPLSPAEEEQEDDQVSALIEAMSEVLPLRPHMPTAPPGGMLWQSSDLATVPRDWCPSTSPPSASSAFQ